MTIEDSQDPPDPEVEKAVADVKKDERKIKGDVLQLERDEHHLEAALAHQKLDVTLVWGGTGASETARVAETDTAGEVFDELYKKFRQKPTAQDTYEVNEKDFAKARFSETVKKLVKEFGSELTFEVTPPTSGA